MGSKNNGSSKPAIGAAITLDIPEVKTETQFPIANPAKVAVEQAITKASKGLPWSFPLPAPRRTLALVNFRKGLQDATGKALPGFTDLRTLGTTFFAKNVAGIATSWEEAWDLLEAEQAMATDYANRFAAEVRTRGFVK
jgi:hypothetical protein